MTCTQERERERERTRERVSPALFPVPVCKAIGFSTTKEALCKKKNFFTSKAHPAVIKNDMVK